MPKKATEAMAMAIHKETLGSKLATAAPCWTSSEGVMVTALVIVEKVMEETLA